MDALPSRKKNHAARRNYEVIEVDTLAQARERLLEAAKECLPETERVALADASGCILAEDIVSGEMIPAFRRSSVDGYAVCSKDTAGATESIPVFLKVLEEVEIGHPAVSKIEPVPAPMCRPAAWFRKGRCMVMVEYSERFGTDEVACMKMFRMGNASCFREKM